MQQSPAMQSTGAQATPLWTVTVKTEKHFLLGINMLACHSYISEMHQSEDNFNTLPLFGNTSFVFGQISMGQNAECLGVPRRLLERTLVSMRL